MMPSHKHHTFFNQNRPLFKLYLIIPSLAYTGKYKATTTKSCGGILDKNHNILYNSNEKIERACIVLKTEKTQPDITLRERSVFYSRR